MLEPGNSLSWTINPATAIVSATKTYDGTTSLTNYVTITGVNGEILSYSNAQAFSKHVGSGNYISSLTLEDGVGANAGHASNYVLPTLDATNAAVTITPITLIPTLSNTGVSKTYDGTIAAPAGFTPTLWRA